MRMLPNIPPSAILETGVSKAGQQQRAIHILCFACFDNLFSYPHVIQHE